MAPLPVVREVRRRFWRVIGSGGGVEEAAAAAGVSVSAGRLWFAQAGGMSPLDLDSPRTDRFLSLAEREEISIMLALGETRRAIARRLGRAASTIGREVTKNTRRPGRGGPDPYRAHLAQKRADVAKARPKPAKLATTPRLQEQVQRRLSDGNSPEQIAGRLRRDFPDDPEMRVCHETIYQAIYIQGRGALRRELAACLRTGRAVRKPRRRGHAEQRGKIPDMVNISQRPPEVEDRAVPGHWEGDLIIGAQGSRSAIGTCVERTTGAVLLLHLPDGYGAVQVQHALVATMSDLPAILRKTLTWDQGRELTNHVQIADATDLDIYFCDPHSPWQRGTNENTNGLLRQYFPKGTDLSIHTAERLDQVATLLNNRPRKRHDWRTPAEVLNELLCQADNPPGVAVTG
ncbi:MAG TPA: IS30 family transposase [Candidatus Limnocylindrales bacterium]